jgi:hypothetical protein
MDNLGGISNLKSGLFRVVATTEVSKEGLRLEPLCGRNYTDEFK